MREANAMYLVPSIRPIQIIDSNMRSKGFTTRSTALNLSLQDSIADTKFRNHRHKGQLSRKNQSGIRHLLRFLSLPGVAVFVGVCERPTTHPELGVDDRL